MIITNIDELPDLSLFTYIYISIGSKYNEDIVASIKKRTNAPFQILPSFVRSRQDPTIAIAIDYFSNTNTQRHTTPNIQVFLYDIGDNNVVTILKTLFDKIDRSPCKNKIVANFVRFISPNYQESHIEMELPDNIQKLLSQREYYTFYQWFGYVPHLYSLMYVPGPIVYLHLTQICKTSTPDISIYNVLEIENHTLWKKVLPYMVDFVHTDEWNRPLTPT